MGYTIVYIFCFSHLKTSLFERRLTVEYIQLICLFFGNYSRLFFLFKTGLLGSLPPNLLANGGNKVNSTNSSIGCIKVLARNVLKK